jgi:crotonobetainyl-CoA:carnitine CoA-transferase CaiB-like acyl-CoA transferase
VKGREACVALIKARIAQRPAAEWLAAFREAGVPAGSVNSVPEVLEKRDASARSGIAPQAPATIRRPPPKLDEHGALIRERGWGAFNY